MMYTQRIMIFPTPAFAPGEIYERICEIYKLPAPAILRVGLVAGVDHSLLCDSDIQVYWLDNLREANRRDLFEIRFKAVKQAREFTDLHLSLEGRDIIHIHQLSLRFPAKGDRLLSSRVIEWLKLPRLEGTLFEIEGFAERRDLRFIRERNLAHFAWNDRLGRYLCGTDHFDEVREIERGKV